jgi:hypothetical protein
VRISSQINEDSLYGRHKRRQAPSSPVNRRLIRLVIALALVIVVMKQSSKPAIYRPFFGTPPVSTQVGGQAIAVSSLTGEPSHPVVPTPIDAADRRIANLLVADLEPKAQREWLLALAKWQDGLPFTVPDSLAALQQRYDSLQIDAAESLSWNLIFEALATPDPPSVDSIAIHALLAALDDAAAARVVDGSVWRAGDFDALYRYLDQAHRYSEVGVAASGVLPLLQQPDAFRNQLIRVHGGVARCEQITAKENVYGIASYWQLWLRPSDGVDRPLIVLVADAPSLVQQVGPEATNESGPQVHVVGKFLKRLAYRSATGAELAPVVVGRLTMVPLTAEEAAMDTANAADTSPVSMWQILLLSCLIGIAIAGLAMYRTAADGKRLRKLRSSHRAAPDDLWAGLNANVDGTKTTEIK